ncbi:hypothetical protein N7455_000140 [Penicillium solitum]|uniref:uncharacterized protein n=1 Tax=Penicillium solitum TaxID=60172 RepID=UPI0032C4AB76|nr:hypothetical protein N7455_000140 [Penicillium solitum]
MPPKSSTAIDNLNKLPGGLWALILLVAAAIVGGIVWFVYIKANKKEEEEEDPQEDRGDPKLFWGYSGGSICTLADISWHSLDTLSAAALTPQAALSARWLRGDDQPSRPLLVVMEATGPNVAVPDPAGLTSEDVRFVPVPPGFRLPPSAPAPPAPTPVVVSAASPHPRPRKRDPAAVSSSTTTLRNASHGAKEVFRFVGDSASVT